MARLATSVFDIHYPALHIALHSVTRRVGREASSDDRGPDCVMLLLLLHTTVPLYMCCRKGKIISGVENPKHWKKNLH
jgi:hypothetical protein